MTPRWWRPARKTSSERHPPRSAQPGPSTPHTEAAATFVRPVEPLSREQAAVWDLVEGWEPPSPDPIGVRTHLEHCAKGRGSPDEVALDQIGDVREGDQRVIVFTEAPASAARAPHLPPFILLLTLDPEPSSRMPALEVLTPDLDPAFLDSDAAEPGDSGRVVVIYRATGHAEQDTAAWRTRALTQTGQHLVEVLRRALAPARRLPGFDTFGPAYLNHPQAPVPPVPAALGYPTSAMPLHLDEDPFPDLALPGAPPPPLPKRRWVAVPEPWTPEPGNAAGRHIQDPALHGLVEAARTGLAGADSSVGLTAPDPLELHRWAARLVCSASTDWAVVRLLRLTAYGRSTLDDGALTLLDEDDACQVTTVLLDVRSLPSAGALHPPVSRLRMLHERLFPGSVALVPARAEWSFLLGAPAVLDTFDGAASGGRAAFSLACDTSLRSRTHERTGTERAPDDGAPLLAVMVGIAPPARSAVLDHAQFLASQLYQPSGPVRSVPPMWLAPPGWSAVEELQITTETYLATVRLEPLPPGCALDWWEAEVFRRASFLRDYQELGLREVSVDGLDAARLHRFDWQPSGRGRTLSNVCVGICEHPTHPMGFSWAANVALEDDQMWAQPDELLSWIRVLR